MKVVLLCFLIGAFIGFSLSAEGDSSARLLVSKNILNQYVVEGKELTVHYNIFNVGSGPATSVSLADNSFPADEFKVLHGLLSVKWKVIAPGANVSHTLILEPKKSGVFNFTSAQVSYKASEDATDPQVHDGQSTDNVQPEWRLDWPKTSLAGHEDQVHMHCHS